MVHCATLQDLQVVEFLTTCGAVGARAVVRKYLTMMSVREWPDYVEAFIIYSDMHIDL